MERMVGRTPVIYISQRIPLRAAEPVRLFSEIYSVRSPLLVEACAYLAQSMVYGPPY
jgi:hypothetical protein